MVVFVYVRLVPQDSSGTPGNTSTEWCKVNEAEMRHQRVRSDEEVQGAEVQLKVV